VKDAAALHQEATVEVRRVVAEARELSREADGALTDHLATWIAGRYAMATRQLAAENGNGGVDWNLLRALCQDLVALRRGDHSAESLRMERERWEMERKANKEDLERQFREWAKENRDKICQGYMTPAQRIDKVREILFGEAVPDGPPPAEGTGNEAATCPAAEPPSAPTDQRQ